MRNMQRKGNAIDFVNDTESAIAGGSLVFFDAGGAPFVGVASTTVPAGASGSARVEGVFLLSPKAGGAVTQGAPLYADTDTGEVSTASTSCPRLPPPLPPHQETATPSPRSHAIHSPKLPGPSPRAPSGTAYEDT